MRDLKEVINMPEEIEITPEMEEELNAMGKGKEEEDEQ